MLAYWLGKKLWTLHSARNEGRLSKILILFYKI